MGRSLSRSSAGSLPREGNEKATSTSHTLEEVETMVHCIISLYESKASAQPQTFTKHSFLLSHFVVIENLLSEEKLSLCSLIIG